MDVARIESVGYATTWQEFRDLMFEQRGSVWLNRHRSLLQDLRRKWTWSKGIQRSFLLLGTPRLAFNPPVRKLVLESHDEKLSAAIRIGKEEGMQVFNDSLYYFLEEEFISRAAAFEISPNVEELKMRLKGIDVKAAAIL